MLGALAGDIIGSVYEWNNIKHKDFPLFSPDCFFTDDSVLTAALADTILSGQSYQDKLQQYYQAYPDRGYGESFRTWAASRSKKPYNSWGNGAAMRISPVGYAYHDLQTVLQKAKEFTVVTHNHPEGIKGAQATAAAIFLARQGQSKEEIQRWISQTFGYDLETPLDKIRPTYSFDVSCQGTVPQAIRAFLESTDFEDAIRNAVSLGGDSDTLACITGGITQAFYGGVPEEIANQVIKILDDRIALITDTFMCVYRKRLSHTLPQSIFNSTCLMTHHFPLSLIDKLNQSKHLVILTGAGVSAESGIATFRDQLTGLWQQYDATELACANGFRKDPGLVWGWYEWRRMQILKAHPNPAHIVIAQLAQFVDKLTLITQNVDDLHERGGSTEVIHLHGNIQQPRCFACARPHQFSEGIPEEPEGGRHLAPPRCGHCNGRIRPGVVWFGEQLPQDAWKKAEQAAENCDLLLSIGTSSLVNPAAFLPHIAARNRATVVQINLEPTDLDAVAHYNLRGKAGKILPALFTSAFG